MVDAPGETHSLGRQATSALAAELVEPATWEAAGEAASLATESARPEWVHWPVPTPSPPMKMLAAVSPCWTRALEAYRVDENLILPMPEPAKKQW